MVLIGLACFAIGALVQSAWAQSRRSTLLSSSCRARTHRLQPRLLLDGALQLAGDGNWERIAVGRAWHLGATRRRGRRFWTALPTAGKVEGSDWCRLGRVSSEAGEGEKAREAFDRAVARDPGDDLGLECGELANVHRDRERAEKLIAKAMAKNPREFWHWISAGGSYLRVRPQ